MAQDRAMATVAGAAAGNSSSALIKKALSIYRKRLFYNVLNPLARLQIESNAYCYKMDIPDNRHDWLCAAPEQGHKKVSNTLAHSWP